MKKNLLTLVTMLVAFSLFSVKLIANPKYQYTLLLSCGIVVNIEVGSELSEAELLQFWDMYEGSYCGGGVTNSEAGLF